MTVEAPCSSCRALLMTMTPSLASTADLSGASTAAKLPSGSKNVMLSTDAARSVKSTLSSKSLAKPSAPSGRTALKEPIG